MTHPCTDDGKLGSYNDLAALTCALQRLVYIGADAVPTVCKLEAGNDHWAPARFLSFIARFLPPDCRDTKDHRQVCRRVLLLNSLDT